MILKTMGETRRRIADRYDLVAEIGAGGMGVVWRARDERLGRDVALKVLAPGTVGNDVARARLIREARAAARLQHDGIVHVYDVGETAGGGAFLVMELVAGRSLRALIDEPSLSLEARVEIIVAMADALAYAHDAGIVHRDVKPDNVLVRQSGRPVLLDFGLAKPLPAALADTISGANSSANLTQDGHVVGTPAYLAPEQARGHAVGPAADQFALAVTAFEVFTRRLPWKGDTVLEVLASMLSDRPLRAAVLEPAVPASASDALERALEKDSAQRFPSVAAFSAALRDGFGLPTAARAHASVPTAAAAASGGGQPPALRPISLQTTEAALPAVAHGGEPQPRRRRRSRAFLAASAALVGGIALLGVRSATSTRDGGPASAVAAPAAPVRALGDADVVACPLFDVSIDDIPQPTAWLGAAAAGLACDRAQVMLGGRSERTLAPAELLEDIPREPAEKAPLDPFNAKGAAAKTREAARQRATAYLEGKVTKPSDYLVSIVVRANDGHALSRGEGHGFELFTAVSAAMRNARDAFAVHDASPFQREWLGAGSIDAALDQLDVTTAILSEDLVETAAACDRFQARTDVRADMAYLAATICAARLKRSPPKGPPPEIDASSSAALVTTIAAHRIRGGATETRARIEKLLAALERTNVPDERAIVAGTIAELAYDAGDLRRAQSAARMSLHASPKLVDIRGTPWHPCRSRRSSTPRSRSLMRRGCRGSRPRC